MQNAKQYELIVGNIGTVYSGTNGFEAFKRFQTYVGQSKSGVGRAGGESVVLMVDGEIQKEYQPEPSADDDEEYGWTEVRS